MLRTLNGFEVKGHWIRRMASSGMLGRVALVRTDVSEELSDSLIRMRRICELGTTLAVNLQPALRRLPVTASVVPSLPILVTLMKEEQSSFETSVLTRATRPNIPEDAILHLTMTFSLQIRPKYKIFFYVHS
jgi:hypothetical protein